MYRIKLSTAFADCAGIGKVCVKVRESSDLSDAKCLSERFTYLGIPVAVLDWVVCSLGVSDEWTLAVEVLSFRIRKCYRVWRVRSIACPLCFSCCNGL